MRKWHGELRDRIQRGGFRQEDVARAVGYSYAHFSRVLRGKEDATPGFEQRVGAVLDRLEAAERAAQEARERVLAETEGA